MLQATFYDGEMIVEYVIVGLLVAGAGAYLVLQAVRHVRPAKGKSCGGTCCSGEPSAAPPARGQQIVLSEDLARRAKARQ